MTTTYRSTTTLATARLGVAALVFITAACGGEDRARDQTATAEKTARSGQQEAAPPEAPRDTSPVASEAQVTPELIAQGERIFHGQEGGAACSTCHGQNATGSQLAPDLTDDRWLNGDGSYEFIVNIVTQGVLNPKEHPAPMPPMGGASLSPEQVRAVAAYVYSLSHQEG
ncbi:MAG: c-type cytochrome [Gemmatimonadales bacterium]